MREGVAPLKVTVDLDLPPQKRWMVLANDTRFATYNQDLTGYLAQIVPKSLIPVLASILKSFKHTFYKDYAAEMEGLAEALGVSVGDIVTANLIYQLENIGVSCEKRNTTGPCPSDQLDGPGLCSGVVADDGSKVWQGRNLDWNLDATLLKYVLQVDYRRNGKTVFVGAQIAGEIGVLHGMSSGSGFSGQINARQTGGKVGANLAEMLIGGKTPTHVLRRALETQGSFAAAADFLSTSHLANPVYYIIAGASHREGAIISRDRRKAADSWHLYEAPSKDVKKVNEQPDWFRFQTNYDHWVPVPDYDDRRTPAVAHMQEDCNKTVDSDCIWKVMTTWPTQNHHTDITAVMCPQSGYFDMKVWTVPAPVTIV